MSERCHLSIFDELFRSDAGLRRSFETLTASSISDLHLATATLPILLGGVALREASRASSAAFIGSCNLSRQLSFQLLYNSMPISILEDEPSHQLGRSVDLIINGETQCQQHLASILPGFSDCITPVSTQHDIQQILDNNAKCNIEESCLSLRDQARMKAVTNPHSGAWLRAIPNRSFGLAMSTQKFVVALRLRLGIAVFPRHSTSYRCTCNHVIHEHGDHALGCGPLRIKRQDAVCDVIYHRLLKENADTRREEGCSTLSFDRPGDVYKPDFSQGKPAYFDVSVKNSFGPSHIINAASKAGVAAEAGKCENDLENVAAAGGFSIL